MGLKLKEITEYDYLREQGQLKNLVREIWTQEDSANNAIHSIERWANSNTESGGYYYITLDEEPIGITGYFVIPSINALGLRHHGTLVPRTGKKALDMLISSVKLIHPELDRIIELIPESRTELVGKFTEWGFELVSNPDLSWEPKAEYYKYMMELRF